MISEGSCDAMAVNSAMKTNWSVDEINHNQSVLTKNRGQKTDVKL